MTTRTDRVPRPDELSGIPWLEALPASERVWAAANLRVRLARSGDIVCSVGDMPTHWIGVIEGLVKMSGDGANGRTVTFAGFPAGGWFGEGTIMKGQMYQYDIQVLQPSVLAWLPLATFHRLLEESIHFNRFLLKQFNERLGQFIAWKAAEQTLTTEERLAQALGTLFNPTLFPRAGMQLKISQQELAYLVGTSRQKVNEALKHLSDAGAAQSEYGGVRLLDLQRLRMYRSHSS